MSLYGDMGNILTIKYRLSKLGWQVIYQPVNMGESLPEMTDFYFLGGGQDKEQLLIFPDLLKKKEKLQENLQKGVAMLAICGGYQLLGESFIMGDGQIIQGLGILPIKTVAPDKNVKSRCVGNIVLKCLIPEISGTQLIGFENHSGRTHFTVPIDQKPNENPSYSSSDNSKNGKKNKANFNSKNSYSSQISSQNVNSQADKSQNYIVNYNQSRLFRPQLENKNINKSENFFPKKQQSNSANNLANLVQPLGQVLVGFGDNTDQIHEGCVWQNVVGTYLHGPCLAKNPKLTNWLLQRAIEAKQTRYKNTLQMPNFDLIDDRIAEMARANILKKLTFGS